MKIVLLAFSTIFSFFLFEKEAISTFSFENQSLVTDTIPPILNLPDTTVFYTTSTDCQKDLSIIPKIEDETPFDSLIIEWTLDIDHDGRINKEGLGILKENFNVGNNWVKFKVTDIAGNSSEIEFNIQVWETNPKPKVFCYNKLSVDLTRAQGCELNLYASDVEAISYHCLLPVTLKLNRVFDDNENGTIDSLELATSPPMEDSVKFDYLDGSGLNTTHTVQLWAVDTTGASAYCLTQIEITPECLCQSGCDPLRIKGCIRNEQGDTLENNSVLFSEAGYEETQEAGCFYFFGDNFRELTITPKNDSFSTTGISTFDLALITKHILRTELLDSPYKMIAADVNNSGSITVLDIIALRKVLLRVENSFPSNSPWRFVRESFEFPNPKNPWETPFPERIDHNRSSNWDFNFIGIQVGNVN